MKRRTRTLLLVAGGLLAAGAIGVSFCSVAPAGFMFVIALVLSAASVFDLETIQKLGISPTGGLTVEMKQVAQAASAKAAEATQALQKVKESEDRIGDMILEMMPNKGGEHYVGGYGEEAEFAIYELLKAGLRQDSDDGIRQNLEEFRRTLALKLIFALVGPHVAGGTGVTMEALKQDDFRNLPSEARLRESVHGDMISGAQFDEVMSAYGQFLDGHPVPPNVIRSLYRLQSRGNN